jgi:hypothetical protein
MQGQRGVDAKGSEVGVELSDIVVKGGTEAGVAENMTRG